MSPLKSSSTLRRSLLRGAALALGLMVPAWAQTPAPAQTDAEIQEDESALTSTEESGETVIVRAPRFVPNGSQTATKSSVPLIKTPQSVSVVTRDQIDLLNFVDIQQAVRYTSGIVGENYGPDIRYDFLTQRGFNPAQYIDGLLAPVSASIINNGVDLYGFQTVDVLKGPASALYGTMPPGGIYNLTSRRPSDEFGGEIAAKYGNNDFYQIAGTATGQIVEGINARITALYRDRGSQTDHVKAKRLYIAPAIGIDLDEDTKLTLLGYYQSDDNTGDTNGFLPVYGTLFDNPVTGGKIPRGTNLGEPDFNTYDRDQISGGYEFVHKFGSDIAFTQTARWSGYNEDQKVVYATGLDADYRTVTRSIYPYRDRVRQFAMDNRVDVKFDTGDLYHRVLVGLDYRNYRENSAYGFAFGAANPIDLFDPVYNQAPIVSPGYPFTFTDQRLVQTGLYIQDQIDVDNFTITLSARQDWSKLTNYVASDDSVDQDKFTYRAGLTYVFENGIAPYISYATSFQPIVGNDSATGRPLKPTEGEQIEAGVKYDARDLGDDIKLFTTASIYQITQKNRVTSVPVGAPISSTQTGEVEVQGFELETVARIRDQITINASYTYADGKVTESNDVDLGARLDALPKHKLSMFADYTIQEGSLAGLGFGFGGRYLSDAPGSLPGPFNQIVYYSPSVTLFDAMVHYDTADWRFAVNGSNIFDKKYVARCTQAVGCFYGEGADVFLSVTRKF